jgi:MFS family permease
VFQIATIALPKIVDERVGASLPLVLVGGIATAVFLCGALAQLAIGRLVEKYPPHLLFGAVAVIEFGGLVWAGSATGVSVLAALALAMAAIYAQVTLNDLIIARYTADAWRGRAYAVRYFVSFLTAAVAVGVIAFFHARGGFDLVLGATAGVALVFLVATVMIVLLVNGVERERATQAVVPAE